MHDGSVQNVRNKTLLPLERNRFVENIFKQGWRVWYEECGATLIHVWCTSFRVTASFLLTWIAGKIKLTNSEEKFQL